MPRRTVPAKLLALADEVIEQRARACRSVTRVTDAARRPR
jgi:hypothetical protein